MVDISNLHIFVSLMYFLLYELFVSTCMCWWHKIVVCFYDAKRSPVSQLGFRILSKVWSIRNSKDFKNTQWACKWCCQSYPDKGSYTLHRLCLKTIKGCFYLCEIFFKSIKKYESCYTHRCFHCHAHLHFKPHQWSCDLM